MRSVIELAGSTATTEVVRAFGFIVRSSRNVDGVGLVIDIVTTIVAALSCCCNHTILPTYHSLPIIPSCSELSNWLHCNQTLYIIQNSKTRQPNDQR